MTSHWLTRPTTLRRLWWILAVVLAATVAAEFLVERHPHFAVESWPAFNAAYGFLACAAMIVLAKGLGLLLKRPDDYYADADLAKAARDGAPESPPPADGLKE